MTAGTSTFFAVAGWALPIVVALAFMIKYYRPPTAAELEKFDELQPEERPPTPEELAKKGY